MRPTRCARGRPGLGLCAIGVVALAACNVITPLDPSLGARFLTTVADDGQGLVVVGDGDDVTATAPSTNQGANTRVVFWRLSDPAVTDAMTCMSWTQPPDQQAHQAGVALRVRQGDEGRTAITVTQNIYFGAFWGFNVHVWDDAATPTIVKIAGFDMSAALVRDGVLAPTPWRLCARVVGDVLTFRVWAADTPEPAWDDPVHAGSVVLPPGWVRPGRAGWYAGHVPPGSALTLADLAVTDLTVVPPPPEDPLPARAPTAIAQAP